MLHRGGRSFPKTFSKLRKSSEVFRSIQFSICKRIRVQVLWHSTTMTFYFWKDSDTFRYHNCQDVFLVYIRKNGILSKTTEKSRIVIFQKVVFRHLQSKITCPVHWNPSWNPFDINYKWPYVISPKVLSRRFWKGFQTTCHDVTFVPKMPKKYFLED
jgi:hypothetical protein